jgi:hypothetical protein
MVVKKQNTSHNSKNGKKYDQVVYWCAADDVWFTIEAPKKFSLSGNKHKLVAHKFALYDNN